MTDVAAVTRSRRTAPIGRSLVVGALVLSVFGCGGSTESDGTGGSGGTSAGGSGATGSSGATGGSGAVAGTGTGAVAGTGAVGGTGPGPECTNASECKLFDDCCSCMALPASEPTPPSCLADCKQSMCSSLQVSEQSLDCIAGRCTAGIDCDASQVFCNALPPTCAQGLVPSVLAGCWGPCVDATQCRGVPSCTACTGPLTTCVVLDPQGTTGPVAHCVDVPKGCEGTPMCGCMAPSVCLPPFAACQDLSGLPGMLCACTSC